VVGSRAYAANPGGQKYYLHFVRIFLDGLGHAMAVDTGSVDKYGDRNVRE